MIIQMLQQADAFREQVSRLKQMSKQWPDYLLEQRGNEIWVSTMVEFGFRGIAFNRHHVETIILGHGTTQEDLIERLSGSVARTITDGQPCRFDDVIGVIPTDKNTLRGMT